MTSTITSRSICVGHISQLIFLGIKASMRLFIVLLFTILFIFSSSIFSTEYTYNPPIGAEVNAIEFAKWQKEIIIQAANISELVQHSKTRYLSERYLNRLIFEASPYLLRHSLNPVNWYPWHADALAKAEQENKLIFLSIGYSTCHWCHVMEKESFTDLEIAKTLNENFISIKVDRELTPDVDLYFTQALELTKGSAGWPINAILTPNAEVVWLDSYLSPEQFTKTLSQLSKVWQSRPQAVKQVAKNLAGQLKAQGNISDIEWSIDKSEQAVKALINNLDAVHGGVTGERKFPNASALQLLLYQYQLNPDSMLGVHIRRFLDKLASQGIRDHLHGGFYRYSTDARWQQPHFEKMLYNQALLISTFSKAYQVFEDENYKKVVIDTIDFVQKWFKSAQGGYYSGIDADYLGSEGQYYLFSPNELALIEQSDLTRFSWCNYNSTVFKFPCSPTSTEDLTSAQQALLSIKSNLVKPHIDKKVITAWNALMISAFVDAYVAFNDEALLREAINLAETINTKHLSQSGKLMRARYQDKLAGKAVINDYAYLASALFTLYQATQNKTFYQLAVKHYQQGSALFGKDYQGHISLGDNLLNDGELISAHTILISLGSKLKSYGEKKSSLAKSQVLQLKKAIMASAGGNFAIHEFFLKNKYGVFENKQYFAKGNGQIRLSIKNDMAIFHVQLAKGWHINSNQPKQDFLIATKIKSKSSIIQNVEFPEAKIKMLGFSQSILSLFEGNFQIKSRINNISELGEKVGISLQACSDKLCLLPEKLSFYLAGK
tara:strand:- start:1593 stop:3926 length:2334 start_codon:yes stop_codon:yes gene_type:complete